MFPLDLAPIIRRLVDEVPAFRLVGGAAEFEAARQSLTTTPAAFVLPAIDVAERSPFGNQVVEQRVTSEFVVLLAVENLAGKDDRAVLQALRPVRAAVSAALLNWQPDSEADGCEYGAGRLYDVRQGTVWWQESYVTAFTLRSE